MKRVKVFGIGFHKTGTKSLAKALRQLGYSVTGPNFVHDTDLQKNLLKKALKVVRDFDAFQDNPWPLLYKEMDKQFPGSKFVLTTREPQSWLRSVVKFFGEESTEMRKYIYGCGSPVGNEDTYLQRYVRHYDEVERYFADRPKDLLVFDLVGSASWEPLCHFLGCAVPSAEFPKQNVQKYA